MDEVFVVTKGCYSDYRIVAVFDTEEAARGYIQPQEGWVNDEMEIETWDVLRAGAKPERPVEYTVTAEIDPRDRDEPVRIVSRTWEEQWSDRPVQDRSWSSPVSDFQKVRVVAYSAKPERAEKAAYDRAYMLLQRIREAHPDIADEKPPEIITILGGPMVTSECGLVYPAPPGQEQPDPA